MGRVLAISAIVHVALLVVVPLVPGLARDYDLGLDVYAVELVDIPAEVTAPAEPEQEAAPEPVEPEPVVEEEAEIPEEPPPKPRRVAVKPPPARSEPTLADRLAERMREQDASRPQSEREETPVTPPAQTSRATVAASRFPYGWYLSVVQGKVSSNWDQPSARLIGEDALTVVVSFRIRRNGSVEAIAVRRSSGRSTVDQSAAKAVSESAPFPPLPDDYLEDRLDVTIDFTITRD